MNKKIIAICLAAVCMSGLLYADESDSVVLSYRRNFIRASLLTKLELVNDAARIDGIDMGALYEDAIAFVLQNHTILGADSGLIDLASAAVVQAGKANMTASAGSIWTLFSVFNDSKLQCVILKTLGVLTAGDSPLASEITKYVAAQISQLESGIIVDYNVFAAGIEALSHFNSEETFKVLFHAAMGAIDAPYRDLAFSALVALPYDFKTSIIAILETSSETDKLNAFRLAMKYPEMDDIARGEIAETALRIALKNPSGQNSTVLADLRFESVPYLAKLQWVQASPLAVEHFYLTQTDFRKGQISLSRFLESVQCLGSMGTAEAAQSLAIYLGLLNSEMEQTKTYNEQVILTVIDSLSRLGDKSAFDYLLYVGYLDYPESVKKAARDALAGLKW